MGIMVNGLKLVRGGTHYCYALLVLNPEPLGTQTPAEKRRN